LVNRGRRFGANPFRRELLDAVRESDGVDVGEQQLRTGAAQARATAWPIVDASATPVTSATFPRRSGGTDDVVDGGAPRCAEAHGAVAAESHRRYAESARLLFERIVRTGDRALRIGEQGKVELHLLDVAAMALDARGVYAERLHLCRLELLDSSRTAESWRFPAGRIVPG